MNYQYVLKELRHHHNRTLINILGIGIGITLFVSINAVSTAYQKAVSLPSRTSALTSLSNGLRKELSIPASRLPPCAGCACLLEPASFFPGS